MTFDSRAAISSQAALPHVDSPNLFHISIALFLAGFSTFSLIYCVQPLLPEFSRDFALTPATSSLALSVTTGCLAVSIMLAGALSEALGRRGLMFFSISGAAVLNLLAAMAPTWHLMLVARALEGFVLGGVPAVAMAYLSEEVPHERLGRIMGLYVGGTAFGGMIGRVAIGGLTEFLSWRAAMGTLAGLTFVAAVAFVWLLPPSTKFKRQPGLNIGTHLSAWGRHLRNPALPPFFLLGFLSMGAFVTVYNYLGYRLLGAPFLLSQTQIGLVFLSYIFGMLASPLSGALADRFGRPRVLAAGALVSMTGLLATLSGGLPLIIVGVVVLTIGFFIVHSVSSGAVGKLAQGHKGHASSLYLLAYYAGSSVMGSVGGSVWRHGEWHGVVAFSGALMAIALCVAIALQRRPATA